MTDRFHAGKRLWSPEDDAALCAMYPHEPTAAIARRLRRSIPAVYARAHGLGLEKSEAYRASPAACRLRRGDQVGARSRFQKGHVPANKGLRRPGWAPGRMRETQFKKHQLPLTYMPVGSTRLIGGYVYRKVSNVRRVPYTVNWKAVHVLLWSETHGPVPTGHALIFRNGDKSDIRLENLDCITRRALMLRNSVHTLPPALASTIQLLGALNRQLRRRTNDAKKQDRRSA